MSGQGECRTPPCPFCASTNVDPEGWKNDKGETGPVCDDCGASAKSLAAWNRRAPSAEAEMRERAGAWLDAQTSEWRTDAANARIREMAIVNEAVAMVLENASTAIRALPLAEERE